MVVFPNAKINIGLNIISERPDGYHNLDSCFYPIGWHDILEIIPSPQLQMSFSGIRIPGNPRQNLCLKAYQLLRNDFKIPSVQMHLHKVIPIGAGLGGGSSDGAHTIKLLNDLFELNLSHSTMKDYARQLGSDCAFFIDNKPLIAKEKGDVFEPTNLNLAGKFLVLIYPKIHISTAESYRSIKPQLPKESINNLLELPIENWKDLVKNNFEASIFPTHPRLRQIKEDLYYLGATYASMSGSGSAIYGIFKEEASFEESIFQESQIWRQQFN